MLSGHYFLEFSNTCCFFKRERSLKPSQKQKTEGPNDEFCLAEAAIPAILDGCTSFERCKNPVYCYCLSHTGTTEIILTLTWPVFQPLSVLKQTKENRKQTSAIQDKRIQCGLCPYLLLNKNGACLVSDRSIAEIPTGWWYYLLSLLFLLTIWEVHNCLIDPISCCSFLLLLCIHSQIQLFSSTVSKRKATVDEWMQDKGSGAYN